ncbi:hypothetical protein HK102_009295, partial [Quaeritorhiza haematococci]
MTDRSPQTPPVLNENMETEKENGQEKEEVGGEKEQEQPFTMWVVLRKDLVKTHGWNTG